MSGEDITPSARLYELFVRVVREARIPPAEYIMRLGGTGLDGVPFVAGEVIQSEAFACVPLEQHGILGQVIWRPQTYKSYDAFDNHVSVGLDTAYPGIVVRNTVGDRHDCAFRYVSEINPRTQTALGRWTRILNEDATVSNIHRLVTALFLGRTT